MFLYNVHTPSRTFALTYKEGEKYDALLDRIAHKAHLEAGQTKALKNGKGGGLVYEYEGEKYSLEEDDDLEILLSRLPPSSTSSTTLHLSVPFAASSQPHAHFAPSPPSYSTAADGVKNKAQKSQAQSEKRQQQQQDQQPNGSALKSKDYASIGNNPSGPLRKPGNGNGSSNGSTGGGQGVQGSLRGTQGFTPTSWNSKARSVSAGEEPPKTVEHTADGTSVGMVASNRRPKSVTSTRSRRSKYGGDPNAEPWVDVHRRTWEAFHNGSGVRTVVGEIAGVPNVRMLLKSGYKGVYISRTFAVKTGIVSAKFGMGSFGYTGLKAMGNVSITVGGKTATHPAMISEEQHFDVVLGRQWLEKVGVKVDPIDQTMLTYMDSGEVISCDIVVLKDDKGNKIFVT